MKEIIKVTVQDGQQVVSAKELYSKLGYDSKNYSRWYKKNIINNDFAIENIDYSLVVIEKSISNSGRLAQDFALQIDFAEKLAMLARTKEGEAVRDYFIYMKKIAHSAINTVINPTEDEQILNVMNILQLRVAKQKEKLLLQAPKVEYYDEVIGNKDGIITNQIAKELGMNARTLNKKLEEMKIQYKQGKQWLPYKKYEKEGYMMTRNTPYEDKSGNIRLARSSVWTEKGREFLHRLFNKTLNKELC
jgi:anti-repressor protein